VLAPATTDDQDPCAHVYAARGSTIV
jgi:hypothetical protein